MKLHCYDGPIGEDPGTSKKHEISESDLFAMRASLNHIVSTSDNGRIVKYDFDKCVVYENGEERSVIMNKETLTTGNLPSEILCSSSQFLKIRPDLKGKIPDGHVLSIRGDNIFLLMFYDGSDLPSGEIDINDLELVDGVFCEVKK